MNRDNEYQAWLNARRAESPPNGLTDRIMGAVRESVAEPTGSGQSVPAPKTALQQVLPYLVCSAAAIVLAVRLYSVVSLFVASSSETELVMNESVEELHDVRKP